MYQIIGVKRALSLFALLCVATTAIWAVWSPPAPPPSAEAWWPTIIAWWKVGSAAVSAAALFVTTIGQTPVFPWVCRLPVVNRWFPPIDGEWRATLESNWPAIQQRSQPGSAPVQLAPVSAKVTIIARLFYIRINLVSDDRYSISKTLFVRASRDPEDGTVQLHYIYRNRTKVPLATDSDCHEGAASLMIEGRGRDLWMEGVYWTNRNWHQGLNTAGKITLRRVRKRSGHAAEGS